MTLREQMDRRSAGLPPPCVEGEKDPLTLTVHLADGEMWVFAWSRFSHARLHGEELTIVFADQEIVVRGQNLATIIKKITELCVEILRTVAMDYRALVPVAEPLITTIEIRSERQQS